MLIYNWQNNIKVRSGCVYLSGCFYLQLAEQHQGSGGSPPLTQRLHGVVVVVVVVVGGGGGEGVGDGVGWARSASISSRRCGNAGGVKGVGQRGADELEGHSRSTPRLRPR